METLTLNDGTVLQNSYAVETMDNLFLYIRNGMNIIQVFPLVTDQDKISEIRYEAAETAVIYGGYTVLQSITTEHGGMISVVLRRG